MIRYITLFEQKLLEWIEKISAKDDLKKELEVLYEWEYKYNFIKQNMNIRNEKRINKMLQAIQKKLNPILNSISGKLIEVFEDWLEKHALLSPKNWARKRIEDLEESMDFDETDRMLEEMYSEYDRYSNISKQEFTNKFNEIAKVEIDSYVAGEILDNEVNSFYDELNYAKEEEDEERIKELEEKIKELENMGGLEYIDKYVGNEVFELYGDSLYTRDAFIRGYEELVFPVWYKHWKKEGIDKTRKRVEISFRNLQKSLKERSLGKKIMYINIALNESHQTGSMMDYVKGRYDVSESDLDKLSNIDNKTIKKWEKEMRLVM